MIGWYVHHQGRGHLERARCIAAALDEPVTGLSSLPAAGAPFDDWVRLPADDAAADPGEPTAHGALHWAPVRDRCSAQRMAALTNWVARERPRAVVVDVSVEAALACRLAGAPVVVVAQPGDRSDAAHTLVYRLADAVVAPWAAEVYAPEWLRPWADKTAYVGSISRFDGRPRSAGRSPVVVALSGAGGRWTDRYGEPVTFPPLPGREWRVLDGSAGFDATWSALCSADVVVAHGGLNALAEVAAARRPTIVVPQPRPFGEQVVTARALHRASIATTVERWPAEDDWTALLSAAGAVDPERWSRWSAGDGAARAAEVVQRVASAGPSW